MVALLHPAKGAQVRSEMEDDLGVRVRGDEQPDAIGGREVVEIGGQVTGDVEGQTASS